MGPGKKGSEPAASASSIPGTIPVVKFEIYGETKMTVVELDSDRYMIGAEMAHLIQRETFNVYRSMRVRHIPTMRASTQHTDVLVRAGAVRGGTRSVTLVPYDAAITFLQDIAESSVEVKRKPTSSRLKRKEKKEGEKTRDRKRRKEADWSSVTSPSDEDSDPDTKFDENELIDSDIAETVAADEGIELNVIKKEETRSSFDGSPLGISEQTQVQSPYSTAESQSTTQSQLQPQHQQKQHLLHQQILQSQQLSAELSLLQYSQQAEEMFFSAEKPFTNQYYIEQQKYLQSRQSQLREFKNTAAQKLQTPQFSQPIWREQSMRLDSYSNFIPSDYQIPRSRPFQPPMQQQQMQQLQLSLPQQQQLHHYQQQQQQQVYSTPLYPLAYDNQSYQLSRMNVPPAQRAPVSGYESQCNGNFAAPEEAPEQWIDDLFDNQLPNNHLPQPTYYL